jgi:hypothetical protein
MRVAAQVRCEGARIFRRIISATRVGSRRRLLKYLTFPE